MPGRDSRPVHRQVSLGHVQVGAADAAGKYLQQQFARAWLRYRGFPLDQRLAVRDVGAHRSWLVYVPCPHCAPLRCVTLGLFALGF
jgi:hypothetical protein